MALKLISLCAFAPSIQMSKLNHKIKWLALILNIVTILMAK
jgi:hypothetical protein